MRNLTLPGLSAPEMNRLRRVIIGVDPSADLSKLGSWGIVPLCCAAQGAQSQSWRANMIEIIQPDDLFAGSLTGNYPDYAVAWRFSQFLKHWAPLGLGLAHARIDPIYREKGLPLSGRGYDGTVKWTALAIWLNSLGDLQT